MRMRRTAVVLLLALLVAGVAALGLGETRAQAQFAVGDDGSVREFRDGKYVASIY